MGEKTSISYCDHSWSPWGGCAHATLPDGTPHPGCDHCYADAQARRFPDRLGVWGAEGTRVLTADWKLPERWNRKAEKAGQRRRLLIQRCDPFEDWRGPISGRYRGFFAADGMCGIWGNPQPPLLTMNDVRRELIALQDRTTWLDWMVATKRPESIRRMWPPHADCEMCRDPDATREPVYRANVWLLYSASDQASLDAGIQHLLACGDLTQVLGLSLEPLLGPVDISAAVVKRHIGDPQPDWVIVGGESGPHARPMELDWLRSIADQCEAAGVKLWIKQDSGRKPGMQGRISDDLWARKELP